MEDGLETPVPPEVEVKRSMSCCTANGVLAPLAYAGWNPQKLHRAIL